MIFEELVGPRVFETYGTQTLKLTFCSRKFSLEFIVTRTELPMLEDDFQTKKNINP